MVYSSLYRLFTQFYLQLFYFNSIRKTIHRKNDFINFSLWFRGTSLSVINSRSLWSVTFENRRALGAQPKIFKDRGGLVELEYFYKHFVKKNRKKGLAGKKLAVFSPRYSWNYILNGKFNSKMDTIWAFFYKIRDFFSIFKIRQGRPPRPSPL